MLPQPAGSNWASCGFGRSEWAARVSTPIEPLKGAKPDFSVMSVASALHALAEHFRRTGHHELADTLAEAAGEPAEAPAGAVVVEAALRPEPPPAATEGSA